MGKIAFVFSGQGDQFPGMGKELAEQYESAAKVFRMCDALRLETSRQCFEGTEEELKETKVTQPCLFAMELAAAEVIKEAGIRPDAVAGFSLGEVVAATFAGKMDYETGFQLVCRRGELMQQAADMHDTAMVAVVKLSQEKVEELCSKFSQVYPVNFNCPGQITVAGLSDRMPDFSAAVREAGGRVLPLKVKGGFHSPFMEEAAQAFAQELEKVTFHKGEIPIYSNVTALPYDNNMEELSSAGNTAELLAKQIANPVHWERIVRNMIASGIDTFIEIGPGKTLSNMIRKIDTEVKVYRVSELSTILSEVKAC